MEHDDSHLAMFCMAPEDETSLMMEGLGYQFMVSNTPTEESKRQVEAVFSQQSLQITPSFHFCKGGVECKSFIQGNDVCFSPNTSLSKLILNKQLRRLIETTLGMEFNYIKEQGPAIVQFQDNQTPALYFTAHPSRDAISVFHPLGERLGWQNGLFKLFTSSHGLKDEEEFKSTESKDVHEISVKPNEILVVIGGLFVQLSLKGGGWMVWQGFSKHPMLEDINSCAALPFMKIQQHQWVVVLSGEES